MPKDQIIGGEDTASGQICPHCSKRLNLAQVMPFLILSRGNTLSCPACGKASYLTPNKTLLYWGAFLLTMGIGGIVALIFILLIPWVTYNPDLGSFVVSGWFVLFGFIAGIWTWRTGLRFYNWTSGSLSDDDMNQSILDFGR